MPKTLYQFVWQVSGRDQAYLCMLSVIVSLLTMVPLELQRRIVNGALSDGTLALLAAFCVAYLFVSLLQGGLKYMLNFCTGRAGEDAICDLRKRIYCGTVYEASGNNDRKGTVVSMVSAEVEPLGAFVGESISTPLLQSGVLLTVFSYMFWVEPLMATVSLLVLTPQLLFVPAIQRRINERSKKRTELLREVGAHIVEGEQADVGETDMADVYAERIGSVRGLRLEMFRFKFALRFLINLLNHLGVVGVLFVGGWLVLQGKTEVGTIVAFLSGMQRVNEPWRGLVAFFRQLMEAQVSYRLITDALAGSGGTSEARAAALPQA